MDEYDALTMALLNLEKLVILAELNRKGMYPDEAYRKFLDEMARSFVLPESQ